MAGAPPANSTPFWDPPGTSFLQSPPAAAHDRHSVGESVYSSRDSPSPPASPTDQSSLASRSRPNSIGHVLAQWGDPSSSSPSVTYPDPSYRPYAFLPAGDSSPPRLTPPQSESSHNYVSENGMYKGSNNSGYVDAALYHPSSPSSNGGHGGQYPRYRQGSFNGSGIESGRASTIGTDHVHGAQLPYNSSRVALNQEWRNSADAGVDSEGIHSIAPGKEGYGRHDSAYDIGLGDEKMGHGTGASYVPLPPSSPALGNQDEKFAMMNGAGGGDTKGVGTRTPEPAVVLKRENRLAWIDGLRGLASLVIFTHHFSDLTWSISHPEALPYGSVYAFIRNGQLAVGMYFLLGGRVLAHSFLKSAFARPMPIKDAHGEKTGEMTKPTGPRWLSLSSSLFRRSIRLAFPAIIVGFIQWIVCITGAMKTAITANEQVLAPSNLWEPTWCNIGNFAGFLRFCLDLFTNKNHQYMLAVGSALWTTYDQFWGSVLVYITAAMVAPIPWRGRYILYTIMCVSLWFINSPNMLYVIGLWLSDLHAAGFIRKVQDHWMPTVAIEIAVMALASAMIAGGTKVATPADNAVGSITVYEGKFGYDTSTIWPQLMLMSNWIPPTMILIWVELSHAMQWFASWGIFVWLGKVSYGFYLMQFLTIYGLMPHLVLAFAAGGNSYWDIVIPAFIICLIFNLFLAWIAYHVLDRIGLYLGKWIWDGFFVSKPNHAAAMPLKLVGWVGSSVMNGPGVAVRAIGSGSTKKWADFKHFCWLLVNWRSPTVRSPVPDPTDPELLSQLHSTRWTADMSHDAEAVRTAKLLRFQAWTWLIHLWLIPGITFIWVWFHPTGRWTYEGFTFSTLWRFVWVLSVPNCVFAYIGFITPDRAPSQKVMDQKPVFREHIRNFFIVLVTKGSNEGAVRRGYNKLLKLEKYHPAVKVIVLTDEPYHYPDLQNVVCPKAYKSPLGKAKYKARALDYFRYHVSLGVYDWILHMDEESVTDGESLRRCIEFVRYTPHHFGQGMILYNGEGFWSNWYFTVADGIRVGDDLARFHFQNTLINRPVFGVHGSFLLTNGEMENECTWDFGSLAEDFEFSQDAWRRGFTCGRIHGIVREQSPTTLRDFLKQRRRWFMGIRDIKGLYGLPHLAINLWIVGVFTLAITVINLPLVAVDSSLTPLWVAICADFCFITFYILYLWGLLFQELDYGQKWWKIPIHLICSIVIQPFASIAEGLSAIWAMSSEDFGKFEVIVKK